MERRHGEEREDMEDVNLRFLPSESCVPSVSLWS